MSEVDVAIEISGITKRFGNIVANRDISLKILRGEIHALVGENGAGKTTLMNILYGMVRPDSGDILLKSKPLPIRHGFIGIRYGIGMIHQHFMLVGAFTSLENVILGDEPQRSGLIDWRLARTKVLKLMNDYGIEVDLDRKVDSLSVGEQQKVEILKVLYRNAEIIIMDEPTSVLTPQEVRKLFATIRMLAGSGKTVIFITHKLEEVMGIADRVTVMRAGSIVGTRDIAEVDLAELAVMMVGNRIETERRKRSGSSEGVVLGIRGVDLFRSRVGSHLSDISFSIRRGEIFGICGVEGNGQDELVEVIIGLQKPDKGRIVLDGKDITHSSVGERLALGMGYIPSDRTRTALIEGMSLARNLILGRQKDELLSRRGFLKMDEIRRYVRELVSDFKIEPRNPEILVEFLSGGNQQKVVVARELSKSPKMLIACNPTRGLDLGATSQIHDLINDYTRAGGSVLLVSADLSEIMRLSDRIGVIYRGRILGILEAKAADEETLGFMMMGVNR